MPACLRRWIEAAPNITSWRSDRVIMISPAVSGLCLMMKLLPRKQELDTITAPTPNAVFFMLLLSCGNIFSLWCFDVT